jgi:hypothetical protein
MLTADEKKKLPTPSSEEPGREQPNSITHTTQHLCYCTGTVTDLAPNEVLIAPNLFFSGECVCAMIC